METSCGSLLSELQKLWDEVGEPESKKDKMLSELEEECLDAYRRKVDQASKYRAQLHKAVADAEAELANIYSVLAERPLHPSQSFGSLKEELKAINPQLEEMRKRKNERRDQFFDVLNQIKEISKEISSFAEDKIYMAVNENDLSLKKLDELNMQLHALQKEKSDRMKQVLQNLSTIKSLCVVLGLDFKQTVRRIHHSLDDSVGPKDVSTETMERLSHEIQRLHELKTQRLKQLQDLAVNMVELWSLMDIPTQEQLIFQNVTKNIRVSENEITEPNTLSLDFISNAETEVSRLLQMKSSKLKEVILKKRIILNELCRKTHMIAEAFTGVDDSVEANQSGKLDLSSELEHVEMQIIKIQEEALSRKDILDKVEKWLAACEEENWLEEYNKDDNRYNAGRGTHLILKRAEKARVAVNKIPAMVEALTLKATTWLKEKGVEFSYDGVSLLSMLENYTILKQEKELDLQRKRDQKKLHGQLLTEQELLFGSKPSPTKSGKRIVKTSVVGEGSRRLSLGGPMLRTMTYEKATLSSNPSKKSSLIKHNGSQIKYQSHSPADLSSGKTIRNLSGRNPKPSPLVRKPLSPVNSSLSSKAVNVPNQSSSGNIECQNSISQKNTPVSTPVKPTGRYDDENRTLNNCSITVPTPPSKAQVSMQITDTPGVVHGGVEYSVEETRASYALAKAVNVPNQSSSGNIAYQNSISQKNTPVSTPAKPTGRYDDENRTPNNCSIMVPTPPSKAQVSMQITDTPGVVHGGVEYSVEETRAGYVLPKSHSKSLF